MSLSPDLLPPPNASVSDFAFHAHHLHGVSISQSLDLVRCTLIDDLAKLYRLKSAGQPVQIPTEVTVKDVVIRLS